MTRLEELKSEIAIVTSQLYLMSQRERAKEQELATLRQSRRNLQKELTCLEVEQKDLLGEIERVGRSTKSAKTRTPKVRDIKEVIQGLSMEDKMALVQELLKTNGIGGVE